MKRKIFVFKWARASGKESRISDEVVNKLVIRGMERLKKVNIILNKFPRIGNQFLILLEYDIKIRQSILYKNA